MGSVCGVVCVDASFMRWYRSRTLRQAKFPIASTSLPGESISRWYALDRFPRAKHVLNIIVIVLAAYGLSVFFFTPRFALWNGLHIPQASVAPEVNRAIDALAQLKEPLVKIENGSNIVLQWRLFFPLLGHFLHLPVPVYLAIPHVGCFAALLYVALISKQFGGTGRQVFYVTTLAATTSWFFVSTGWLSYEDSWNIFGLLLVTFSRSRAVLLVTCLYEPFIDERFILAIPLVLALRLILATDQEAASRRRLLIDAAVISAPLAPYVLLRIVVLSRDHGSIEYLTNRMTELRDPVAFTQYLLGFWMGLRLLWASVAGVLLLLFWNRRWAAGSLLTLTLAFSIAVAMVIAADLSRSMSIMLPAAVVGTLLLIRSFPEQMKVTLPAMMIGNLMLPACHVVTLFNSPIFYFYSSINECAHPPAIVNADDYTHEGAVAALDGKYADALKLLDSAVELNSRSVVALTTRGMAKAALDDHAGAMADVNAALRIDPASAKAVYARQMILKRFQSADPATAGQRPPTSAAIGASP